MYQQKKDKNQILFYANCAQRVGSEHYYNRAFHVAVAMVVFAFP